MKHVLSLVLATCLPSRTSFFAGANVIRLLAIIALAATGTALYLTDNPLDGLALFLMAAALVMSAWEVRLMIWRFVICPQKLDFERPRNFYSDAIKQAIAQKIQQGQCEPLSQAESDLPYVEQPLRLTPDELALVCKQTMYSLPFSQDWNDLTRICRQDSNDLLRHAAELTYGMSKLKTSNGTTRSDYYSLQNIAQMICSQALQDAAIRIFDRTGDFAKQSYFSDDFDRLDQFNHAFMYFLMAEKRNRQMLSLQTSQVLARVLPTIKRKERTFIQKLRFARFIFIVHFFGTLTNPGKRFYKLNVQD